ncbi:hypothetical protein EDD11_003647 [Mortierella claussenii]|nr:hypothetical protein EDD11_003647 [Mortierella claussenii]
MSSSPQQLHHPQHTLPPLSNIDSALEGVVKSFMRSEKYARKIKYIVRATSVPGRQNYKFAPATSLTQQEMRLWRTNLMQDEVASNNPFWTARWMRVFGIAPRLDDSLLKVPWIKCERPGSNDGDSRSAVPLHRKETYLDLRDEQNRNWAMDSFTSGIECAQKGQLDEAIKSYSQAIQIDSKCVEAYVARGCTLANIKKWRAAIMDFRAALSLDPSNISARQYLESTIAQEEEYRLNPMIESIPPEIAHPVDIDTFNGNANLDNINEIVIDTEAFGHVEGEGGNKEKITTTGPIERGRWLGGIATGTETEAGIGVETEVVTGVESVSGIGVETGTVKEIEIMPVREIEKEIGSEAEIGTETATGIQGDDPVHHAHAQDQGANLCHDLDPLPRALVADQGQRVLPGTDRDHSHSREAQENAPGLRCGHARGGSHYRPDNRARTNEESHDVRKDSKELDGKKDSKELDGKKTSKDVDSQKDKRDSDKKESKATEAKDTKDNRSNTDQQRPRSKSRSRSRSRERSRSKSTTQAAAHRQDRSTNQSNGRPKVQDMDRKERTPAPPTKDSHKDITHAADLKSSGKDDRKPVAQVKKGDDSIVTEHSAAVKTEGAPKDYPKEAVSLSHNRSNDHREPAADREKENKAATGSTEEQKFKDTDKLRSPSLSNSNNNRRLRERDSYVGQGRRNDRSPSPPKGRSGDAKDLHVEAL